MNQNKYMTLVRREFWEHRSLWIGPVVVATLLVVVAAVAVSFAHNGTVQVHGAWGNGTIKLPDGATPMAIGVFGLATQIIGVAGIIASLYLLDSLYAERRDRSILFWKSLPVSDAATVLAKFAVGMLLVPLLAYLLAAVVYPLIYGIAAAGLSSMRTVPGGWNTLDWLRAEGSLLLSLLLTLLWYAPLGAWMMLASVLAKRMPGSFVVLPVVVLGVLESALLQTGHVWRFVGRRLFPIADPMEGVQRLDLWLGVVVAVALMYLVIRLRRYRDDT